MKKLSILLAVAAFAFGFGSCAPDRNPVYTEPTEFKLNTPAMMDQYIELTDGNTLELFASQPNYGYAAAANYSVQVSLDGSFEEGTYKTIKPSNVHSARLELSQYDIAAAICGVLNIEDEETYDAVFADGVPYMRVFFRAYCSLPGVESSGIASNFVYFNNMKPFFAVAVPGYIYLVGNVSGWAIDANSLVNWRLFENDEEIGSGIYYGTFYLSNDNGNPMFRFYTEAGDWDANSWGTQEADSPIQFDYTGEPNSKFEIKLVSGKGSVELTDIEAGYYDMKVDMSNESNVKFTMTPHVDEEL